MGNSSYLWWWAASIDWRRCSWWVSSIKLPSCCLNLGTVFYFLISLFLLYIAAISSMYLWLTVLDSILTLTILVFPTMYWLSARAPWSIIEHPFNPRVFSLAYVFPSKSIDKPLTISSNPLHYRSFPLKSKCLSLVLPRISDQRVSPCAVNLFWERSKVVRD